MEITHEFWLFAEDPPFVLSVIVSGRCGVRCSECTSIWNPRVESKWVKHRNRVSVYSTVSRGIFLPLDLTHSNIEGCLRWWAGGAGRLAVQCYCEIGQWERAEALAAELLPSLRTPGAADPPQLGFGMTTVAKGVNPVHERSTYATRIIRS